MIALGNWFSFSLQAQSIVRSTICSIGATQTGNDGTTLLSTYGQCPGCSTLVGPDGTIILQGFQQPSGISPDCVDIAAFDFEPTGSSCGTTYSFFYIGNADVNETTFEWDFGVDALPQTSNSPNPMDVSFTAIGSKQATLTVTNSLCNVSESVSFLVTELAFGVNPTMTDVGCKGESTGSIVLEPSNGTAPYTIAWSNGSSALENKNLQVGDYAYTVVDGDGCEATNLVTVTEPENEISIEFTITSVTCADSEDGEVISIVNGGTAPYIYQWSNDSNTNAITGVRRGNFELTVTDTNGCKFSNSGEIGEACRPTIYNIISPNGDDLNDNWEIVDIQNFPDNEVKIYNRWGSLVFDVSSYNNDWKGTDKDGNDLLSGAYYYVVNLNNEAGIVLTGSVTIVR
ncbi:MAG: gliding motility-associated-like protein [Saprospiraceae bacterium]|jgi:gliding motility-associated-like protein